jgi:hypothetical protein
MPVVIARMQWQSPQIRRMFAVGSRYKEAVSEDREDGLCAAVSVAYAVSQSVVASCSQFPYECHKSDYQSRLLL